MVLDALIREFKLLRRHTAVSADTSAPLLYGRGSDVKSCSFNDAIGAPP
jgi:hypothetical protein